MAHEQPAPLAADAAPASPGVVAGALRVFDLSLSQMLWSRRTVFMALVVGLPVLIALAIRALTVIDETAVQLPASGSVVFGLMIWAFFIRFAIPVLAIFYGTGLIADEVEDKTITYLFTRPIPRESVLLGKFLAYLVCTIAVVLPAVIVIWLLVAPIQGSLGASFPALAADLGIIAAGLMTYGALFALVGATFKRPLLFGLLFVFGWENLALALPGRVRQFTVAHYVQGLVPHSMPADSPAGMLQTLFGTPASVTESLIGLTVITILGLWLAARAVSRREYVLEH